MIVVSNATPIITLSSIGKIDILKYFFDKVYIPQDILLNDLDLGEAQTIVLAKELNADIVLIDETIGYNLARSQKLNVKRTLSFLIVAKERGLIEEVKPLLNEMIENGRWISRRVYKDILKVCGEE